jgi:hypothetical protein
MDYNDIHKTYVITLPNSDRQEETKRQLDNQGIKFEWYTGIRNKKDGATGLRQTFKAIFTDCLKKGFNTALIFEDDIEFCVKNNFQLGEMMKVINDLPDEFQLCKFGANLLLPVTVVTENLNRIKLSYALHAVLYSRSGMEAILQLIDNNEPIDVLIAKHIEPLGYCFASSKFIITQRTTQSNIFVYDEERHSRVNFYNKENGTINWDGLMKQQWENNTKHLKQ